MIALLWNLLCMPKRKSKKAKKGRNKNGTFKKGHKLSRTSRNRKAPKRRSNAKPKKRRGKKSYYHGRTPSRRSEVSTKRLRNYQRTTGPSLPIARAAIKEAENELKVLDRELDKARKIPNNLGEQLYRSNPFNDYTPAGNRPPRNFGEAFRAAEQAFDTFKQQFLP